MPTDDFSVIYSGNIVQMDFLKSLLEGNCIQCVLQDEYVGRMRPYAVPGGDHTRAAYWCSSLR